MAARNNILELISQHGGTDGAHHKQWLLDQIVRELTGDGYERWVVEWEGAGPWEWDTGIAP